MSTTILTLGACALLLTLSAAPASAQGTMFVEGDNVGIGTPTPAFPLHIQTSGAVAARDLLLLENPGATRFRFVNNDSGQTWEFKLNAGDDFAVNNPSNPGGEFIFSKTGDLLIAGDLFSATCSGSPCAPDYVFDKDYELMSLPELERFVSEKRHLPNIPPARDMADRVNLSKMQMSLLKKVEELTLYVIALDKENAELRQAVERLARSKSQ